MDKLFTGRLVEQLTSFIDERWFKILAFFQNLVPDFVTWFFHNLEVVPAVLLGALWGELSARVGRLTASLVLAGMVVLAVLI